MGVRSRDGGALSSWLDLLASSEVEDNNEESEVEQTFGDTSTS